MTTVEDNEKIRIKRLMVGPFSANAYILICQRTGESVLVDAPGEADRILEAMKGARPKYILITHNHFDHTRALSKLKKVLKLPVAAHLEDAPRLPIRVDMTLNDGDNIPLGNIRLEVLHTPGHTPGSICILSDPFLISGDTLFPGGPGKTTSPGDFQKILQSLDKKIFKLPGNTVVYPGHETKLNKSQAVTHYSASIIPERIA
ncbi:MAG: MBL fold metallo-hydrolase, partial [Thermodesulfobacteriota bacterium]|nr:MBL fold metallo-hydrolase [Thermodesulfobacteriota bacterium]